MAVSADDEIAFCGFELVIDVAALFGQLGLGLGDAAVVLGQEFPAFFGHNHLDDCIISFIFFQYLAWRADKAALLIWQSGLPGAREATFR